jgi:soluble lytic murein transglycosylase
MAAGARAATGLDPGEAKGKPLSSSIRRVLFISVAGALFAALAAQAQTITPLNPPARAIQTLSAPAEPPAAPPTQPVAPAPSQPATPQTVTTAQPPAAAAPVPDSAQTPATVGSTMWRPPYAAAPAPPNTETPAVAGSTASQGQYVAPPAAPTGLSEYASSSGLSGADLQALAAAIGYARRGEVSAAQAEAMQMADPVARKVVLWATIDADGEALPFYQLDQAKRDLAGWPRLARRQLVTEKALSGASLPPQQIVAWFAGAAPTTPQGAMALAEAEIALGGGQDAAVLIKHWWRDQVFDEDVQRAMLERFGSFLTVDDHVKRADTLLYGAQGPALHDLLSYLPPDQLADAHARMALRDNDREAMDLVAALPPAEANDPGVALEEARYLHARDLDSEALALVPKLPMTMPCNDAAEKSWLLRKQLINAALKGGDYQAAYTLAAGSGLTEGVDYTEAEFYAGWLALSKLHEPQVADAHFANIQTASSTPISQARALYWRGRAADAENDEVQAAAFYAEGGRYETTFYGQLAAAKAGVSELVIGHDPVPTAADRARFESLEVVRAARMLAALDDRELFRSFVLAAADDFTEPCPDALLVDLALGYGDQDLAMRVVRVAAQHDVVLPERGYPVRATSVIAGMAEPAMVFSLTRQESNFDPRAHSGVGARGLMQIMPGTAAVLARKLGEPYYPGMLDDPDYNMRLGAYYIGSMIDDFGGSYLLAAAAYNAGPGRPAEWVSYCGDPRSGAVDPVDFIECIPFSETRNYVMRVLESAEVYRARLNGGTGPNRLATDLKRGGYVYAGYSAAAAALASSALLTRPGADEALPK